MITFYLARLGLSFADLDAAISMLKREWRAEADQLFKENV